MKKFDGISFLWAVVLLALIGALFAIRAYLGYRNVARDAEEDFDYKQERGMLDGRIDRDGYIQVFKRLHNPRNHAYIASAILAILVLTWPIMAALSVVLEQAYQLSGQNRVFEPGYLVWQFCIFFGIIFSWTGIAYLMARRYHRLAPGTEKYELGQHVQEQETGARDKPICENDWGMPPFMVIGSVFLGFAAIIYRIFFR